MILKKERWVRACHKREGCVGDAHDLDLGVESKPGESASASPTAEEGKRAYLVDAVTERLELLDAAFGLLVRVVAGSNGAHRRRLVSGVRLGAVLEIRVWTSWTVAETSPDVSCPWALGTRR